MDININIDLFSLLVGLVGVVVGLISIGIAVYYGKKSNKFQKLQRSISWTELQHISDSIFLKLKKDKFVPDLILCPGTRGAILAELLLTKFERKIPIFIGISYRDFHMKNELKLSSYKTFKIEKRWDILIPTNIFDFKEKKVLIVDDFCMAGIFFEELRHFLVNNGFQKDNVKVYCCTITNVTKNSERVPEYYSITTEDDNFYFPWGKANLG